MAKHIAAQANAKIIAQAYIWLAILRASLSARAPMYCAISTDPATVIPVPKLITIFWTGVTRLIAASSSLPICPSQYVSVRLYIVCRKLLITTGIASERIALSILPFKIRSRLYFFAILLLISERFIARRR